MMEQILIQIIGGIVIIIISAIFGISRTSHVIHSGRPRKTGKWIIIISVIMIFGGMTWMGSTEPQSSSDWLNPPAVYGLTLSLYGILFYVVGRVVAWFQRL